MNGSETPRYSLYVKSYKVRLFIRSTRILMADSEKEITPCGNFIWVNCLNYLCLIKHLGLWTTFVLNNLTSAYFLRMFVSKTRNANSGVTQWGNLISNGVKCNEKGNWVLVLRLPNANGVKLHVKHNWASVQRLDYGYRVPPIWELHIKRWGFTILYVTC